MACCSSLRDDVVSTLSCLLLRLHLARTGQEASTLAQQVYCAAVAAVWVNVLLTWEDDKVHDILDVVKVVNIHDVCGGMYVDRSMSLCMHANANKPMRATTMQAMAGNASVLAWDAATAQSHVGGNAMVGQCSK